MTKKVRVTKCIAALAGIFLVGAGVAFNAQAQLGNDPIGIFYDGVRNLLGLNPAQLGHASNVVNALVVVLLMFIGRRYVNIGTLIYILPYGFFVNIGTSLYQMLFVGDSMITRIFAVVIGCLSIYIGVAIYIVMDIGVDPMTGLALWIGEKLHWEYKRAKVLFDLCLTAFGFIMGGKLGVITVISSLVAGPMIQFFAHQIKRIPNYRGFKEVRTESN